MTSNKELTQADIKKLIYTWFKKLTDHAPVEEMVEMLDENDLEMKFPEATLKGVDDFKEWYHTVTHKFFDQVHELKMLDITIDGPQATVSLVVNWQARSWDPPAGYSKWDGVYAHQTWTVVADHPGEQPAVIQRYSVDKFEPMEGPLKI